MSKKRLFLILGTAVLLTTISALSYILLIQQRLRYNPSPKPTPAPTIAATLQKGSFVILPNNYPFTDKEKQAITESEITTALVDSGTSEYIDTLRSTFPKLIVLEFGLGADYRFCGFTASTIIHSTASTVQLRPTPTPVDALCYNDTKFSNVVTSSCSASTSECLTAALIARQSTSPDTYYYSPQFPLIGISELPTVQIDEPLGTQILSWQGTLLEAVEQSSYSIEVLDSEGKRIQATGRVNAANTGDLFIPTQSLTPQALTIKLRLWLKYGNVATKNPIVITKEFGYDGYQPSLGTPSSRTAKQMSWIPDWGMADGIASIRKNPTKWDTISPVWFTPNKNGTINKEPTVNSAALLKLLRDNNIRLVPTISLFDADVLQEILNKNLDTHVAEIVSLVNKNNYAGIDLDYESTYEADRALLTEFITKLAEQLHQKNKTLSFTALPKIDDRRIYAFLPQTHQAQDWQAIGAVVDEFRIMAYDFTGQGSAQPGPLSPYQWNEALIKYAISKMPAEKVVLALPLYSHGWPKPKTSNLAGENNDQFLSSGKQKNTISLQHLDIDYIKGHSVYYREAYDTWNKEVRSEFKYNGVERVMYYLNKKSITERIDLARQYGIKGVCYWRIGDDSL